MLRRRHRGVALGGVLARRGIVMGSIGGHWGAGVGLLVLGGGRGRGGGGAGHGGGKVRLLVHLGH